jgi:hypothetical protein
MCFVLFSASHQFTYPPADWLLQACLRYGQLHHRVESRVSLRLLGHEATRVKEMKEEDAVQLGATMLSEAFLLLSAAGLLLWEMGRKSRDDARAKVEKEAKEQRQREELEARFQSLEAAIHQLQQQMLLIDTKS